MQTQTFINIDEITEEKMRRHELAEQYAASARTKIMMSKNQAITVDRRLALARDAIQDVKDGMSILSCGFVRPLGVLQTNS